MVSVILACGGSSTRMGGVNKLFMELDGMTVVERTILAFDAIDEVSEIVLCCSEEFGRELTERIKIKINKPLKLAPNGKTRQQSVFNGFEACDSKSELVCIHDGARPLVLTSTIKKAFADAREFQSAVVCVPCKDTVKLSDGKGTVQETPPRERLFLTQTPQVFRCDKYKEAVLFARKNGNDYTDDSQLFEAMGIMPHITVGDYSNIKITTPEDIAVASQLLRQQTERKF